MYLRVVNKKSYLLVHLKNSAYAPVAFIILKLNETVKGKHTQSSAEFYEEHKEYCKVYTVKHFKNIRISHSSNFVETRN